MVTIQIQLLNKSFDDGCISIRSKFYLCKWKRWSRIPNNQAEMLWYGLQSIKDNYLYSVNNIYQSVEERFKNLRDSPIFNNIGTLLDTFSWQISADAGTFGNQQVIEICVQFRVLLESNGCDTSKVAPMWLTLKSYIIPLIQNKDRAVSGHLEESFSK